MQNNSEQEKKDRVLKSLAIAGFVGLLIVISWLGIQLVNILPNAFSSLASLADSVYRYEPTKSFTVTSNKSRVSIDESFAISWEAQTRAGSYAFSYECADGLAVDMRDVNGGIKSLTCATNYNLGDVKDVNLIATTEKTRFTDIVYSIDFIPSGKEAPVAKGEGRVTVTNASIATIATSTPETPIEKEPEEPIKEAEPEEPAKPVVTTPKPTTPTPVKPTYVETPIYGIPTSNPNGFTDLTALFISNGILKDGKYIVTGTIDNDAEKGAFQFVVQNIGTKTSNEWTYNAQLPNGTVYTSPLQKALKPNERSIITLGFTVPKDTGLKSYSVVVTLSGDSKSGNNSMTNVVTVTE